MQPVPLPLVHNGTAQRGFALTTETLTTEAYSLDISILRPTLSLFTPRSCLPDALCLSSHDHLLMLLLLYTYLFAALLYQLKGAHEGYRALIIYLSSCRCSSFIGMLLLKCPYPHAGFAHGVVVASLADGGD